MKHIQNNQKSIGKSLPAHGFKKSQENDPLTKSLENFANVCDFQKENYTPGYGIYRKSIDLEMDFYSCDFYLRIKDHLTFFIVPLNPANSDIIHHLTSLTYLPSPMKLD